MKHIFVINPTAGQVDKSSEIIEYLKKYDGIIDYEYYLTKAHGDATHFVKEKCECCKEELRFYACGGDGTLNEVLIGMAECNHASLTNIPTGSGNDFLKCFEGKDFSNIDSLINGETILVDLLKVNDKYSINIANFGLDANVCVVMDKVRRKKIIGGKNAYTTGLLVSLFKARKNYCEIKIDGKDLFKGKILLCACANGQIYGGGYKCAPNASITDGEFDLCMLKCVPFLKIAKLVNVYKEGKHLDSLLVKPYLVYLKGKHLSVDAPKGIALCLDGEVDKVNHFEIDVLEKKLKFVIPA